MELFLADTTNLYSYDDSKNKRTSKVGFSEKKASDRAVEIADLGYIYPSSNNVVIRDKEFKISVSPATTGKDTKTKVWLPDSKSKQIREKFNNIIGCKPSIHFTIERCSYHDNGD